MKQDSFRWQVFFQRSSEPLFLLNRRRRLLFVNAAWEQVTGKSAGECRGMVCRRHRDSAEDPTLSLAGALCPPAETFDGQPARARRLVPGREGAPVWCDIDFLPIRAGEKVDTILGKMTPLPAGAALSSGPLPEDLIALRAERVSRFRLDALAGTSPALRRLIEQVRLASRSPVPVLLVGGPGTGKQWVARTIHYQSPQRESPCIGLDCANLPAASLAAILFGLGGTVAHGGRGVLYLKEPSRLPREMQDRLCQLLADANPAGPRIMAGACVPLAEEVRAGRLVDDLYYVLSTVVLELPLLRERPAADLARLVDRLLERANAEGGRPVTGLTPEAWEVFYAYTWPGNLRELFAVLAGARIRTAGAGLIDMAHLPAYLRLAVRLDQTPAPPPPRPVPLDHLLEEAERRLIQLALRLAKGNKSRAAELLAIVYPRLFRRMQALGIKESP
jgi:transcriptional regulator with GAF, ATPase, and Fis domain